VPIRGAAKVEFERPVDRRGQRANAGHQPGHGGWTSFVDGAGVRSAWATNCSPAVRADAAVS
jgi:hypothetical protein